MTSPSQSRIIGMMSGTSVDSVDAVLCDVEQSPTGRLSANVLAIHEHSIPHACRQRIFTLFKNDAGSLDLACSLNFEIGELFAQAAEELIRKSGVERKSVTAIASHGQTAWHIPPHDAGENSRRLASTLQIGEAAVIAEKTKITVISDFRVADMAAGGNGAPLVPFADYHLFSRAGEDVIVHNIGGIANCTYLPASGRIEDVMAFDTGPGNMIIDALVQRFFPGESYDADGHHARKGRVIEPLLKSWMVLTYISMPPPKSTGRELFGVQFADHAASENSSEKPEDLIATATEFTAQSFARSLKVFIPLSKPPHIFIAGGGARNGFLLQRISLAIGELFPGAERLVQSLDKTGFDPKARECVGFALLGHARINGMPGNVPSATGARHPAILGKLTLPPQSQFIPI